MTEKVSTTGEGVLMVDLNSLNKTGCCYMSCNFLAKQWYIHFKKKHFEKLQEIIGSYEGIGKHEARLEFLQVKRAKFFRVCLKSKELKYDRRDCRSAEEDMEVLNISDFMFAAAKAKGNLGCISKTTASRSWDVLSPVLLGTCQATLSIVHPGLVPPAQERHWKMWEGTSDGLQRD